MADVRTSIARGDAEKARELDLFLADLLRRMRAENFPNKTVRKIAKRNLSANFGSIISSQDIDTSLLKLLCRPDFPDASALTALLSDDDEVLNCDLVKEKPYFPNEM